MEIVWQLFGSYAYLGDSGAWLRVYNSIKFCLFIATYVMASSMVVGSKFSKVCCALMLLTAKSTSAHSCVVGVDLGLGMLVWSGDPLVLRVGDDGALDAVSLSNPTLILEDGEGACALLRCLQVFRTICIIS